MDAPNALHHVMVRGSEWSAYFWDDIDRADFVGRLVHLAEQKVWGVAASVPLPPPRLLAYRLT